MVMKSFEFGEYSIISSSNIKQNYKPLCAQKKCTFSYPCTSQIDCTPIEININKGRYLFEAFGAQGGYYYAGGGMGGYAAATIVFLTNLSILLTIGAMGTWGQPSQIFNGGGASSSMRGAGGGATDYRAMSGILASRFLIAGGGGGEYFYTYYSSSIQYNVEKIMTGGFGGGENSGPINTGASQTGPGSSGNKGGPGKGASGENCGGGGGLYGGNYGSPCGGGSGFVYSKNRLTKIIDDIDENLMKVENGILQPGMNSGNGYATITLVSNEIDDKNALKNWIMTCPCKISPKNASYYLFYGLVNAT